MNDTFAGKMWLLAFVLFFLGWSLVSIHYEEKMRVKLEQTEIELEQAKTERASAISSLENSMRAKEQIHAELTNKKNEMAIFLDAVPDWSGMDIPDDIIRMLQEHSAETDNLCTTSDTFGRSEDTPAGESENSWRYGTPSVGR